MAFNCFDIEKAPCYNDNVHKRKRVNQTVAASQCDDEESPSSPGQWCWVTPSRGDSKDSATERYRLLACKSGKGGKVR